LASYESGRVPLRFEVFKAINQHYFLDPMWLATGAGVASQDRPFPLGDLASLIPPRATFTEVYDAHLDAMCKDRARVARVNFDQCLEAFSNLAAFLKQNPKQKLPPDVVAALRSDYKKLAVEVEALFDFEDLVARGLKKRTRGRTKAA
jgi:hypothetical protein